MPTNDADLQAQARSILDAIAFIPFEQCQPLSREFESIPARPGIYAVRHKTDGYSTSVKRRAYGGVLVADTKLFFGHGLTNTTMRMCGLQCRSFRIGKTLRYYWN
jgi:hypothetical protein